MISMYRLIFPWTFFIQSVIVSSEVKDFPVMPENCSSAFRNGVTFVVVEDIFDDGIKIKQLNEHEECQKRLPFWLDKLPVVPVQKYCFQ